MLAAITGASSGIGAMFARKLAARGYDLLLIARREDRLVSIGADIRDLYRVNVATLAADLTVDPDRDRAAERIRSAPDLGLLVNNAGFGTMGYFWEADLAGQENMHRLHVLNTVSLTHAALSNLVPRGKEGTGVINVSSVAAFSGSPQNVSYHSTKAWMNAFTETLAIELMGRGSPVTMQALCPGFTLSEFHDVLHMERASVPSSLWMTAEFVVEESLRAFDKRKLIVIPGWRYRLMMGLLKLVPAPLMRRGSIIAVQRYRKRKQE